MVSSRMMRGFADALEEALADPVWLDWHGPFRVQREGWAKHPIFLESCAVYMFLDSERVAVRGQGFRWIHREVLRVGKTYDQALAKRIKQYDGTDEWDTIVEAAEHEVTIKVARVGLEPDRRMSRGLLHDIENLLLVDHKPIANAIGKKTYEGRPLIVQNEGNPLPLRPTISSLGRRRT